MRTLLIINDPPYGMERAYNAMRIANSLAKREDQGVRVFLMGDAASCAKSGKNVPQRYYSLERMLKGFRLKGGETGVCGTCSLPSARPVDYIGPAASLRSRHAVAAR